MPRQSKIRPQEYIRGTGWQAGDRAPTNAYRATDTNGLPVGPVVYEPPPGRGVLLVTVGTQISEHTARLLDVPAPVEPEPTDPDPED